MRASAHIRLRVSVQKPQTIHAGEIIYLQQRTDKDPINQYALYENTNPTTLLGPMVAERSDKQLQERGGGLAPASEHATPVLVATGAQFTRKNEVQFLTIVAYGFGHLSAEKSDLHPPPDITVNEQMHVEYDPNIYRGVICDDSGGSPFCKAIYSVSTAMDRADTDVYLTLDALFITPEADRDAVDGEPNPTFAEVTEDSRRAELAEALTTRNRLEAERRELFDSDALGLSGETTSRQVRIFTEFDGAAGFDPRDFSTYPSLVSTMTATLNAMTRTTDNADRYDLLKDDIKFMNQWIKAEEKYFVARDERDAAVRAIAFDQFQAATKEDAANQPNIVPKVTSVARLASNQKPKGRRVKPRKT